MGILEYPFMQNALAAALLASVACGVIGAYVVVKRIASISGGIAHTAFGGVGLGYFLGVSPLLAVLPFTLAAAVGIGWLSRRARIGEDSVIGIFWAAGMSLGIIFIRLTPGYAPDLMSYLFGNILTVPRADLALMAGLDALILMVVYALYPKLLAFSFDEEYALAGGLNTRALNRVLLCLVALTVVVLMRVVGVVLVIALLTLPAALARRYTANLRVMMLSATGISAGMTLAGLALSYLFDLPSGATIVLVAGAAYLLFGLRPAPVRAKATG